MQKAIIIAIVVVAVLLIGWAVIRTADEPAEPTLDPAAPAEPARLPADPTESPAVARPAPQEPAEPAVELPSLEDSDPFVRERIDDMDLPRPWLDQDGYVRRLAVLAENASRGVVPRRQLAFLAPNEPFQVVRTEDERILLDPVGYTRYDGYVDRLERIAPDRLASLLTTLNPLVEAALVEVGVEAPPGEVFAEAIRQVLAVPLPQGDIELIQPAVMYRYADPQLEALPQLHKQLLRMGPDNVRRLQAYLRQVAAEMNLDL
jgi:hypothetical protein